MTTAPEMTISAAERTALRQALAGAARFAGATSPNPPVGCVLLDENGAVLAEGFHMMAGEAHAEAIAIASARALGVAGRIHTVVATLEPCNHHGRTPPCSDAILATPARRVVIAAADPNPAVRGGGAARLKAAGLDIVLAADHPELRAESLAARRLIAPFAKHARTGRPWVTVKQAVDEAGGMVPPPGRKTFTARSSLLLAHRLRRRADAILTGSGTVLADNPEFTVRHVADFPGKQRFLALLDRRRRVPSGYIEAARARGFTVLRPADLDDALALLGARGALEVLVEAGPSLTAAVLDAGLADEHVLITKGNPDHVAITHANPEFDAVKAPGEEQ
ncbi:bifunctional diaminohydroxyphosphoribosylaminopyrimidine deaminase/5-amino-6-(5-phosphoribosylamino)uracil reductase RibD [Martelella soudanensis]|uniref:bifunctional diaminohydroxyphosphoribosylaminopyrimidine deaminase/5-amino-6-(5-phosphoribosylamino)uracil reductase RibD n=1 Tax=unclassified Martelella TaxID=2629616 RepID=UPI0015DF1F47|nr:MULTISPECIES: bifunctional diaminohydroxyphosphoribosylaminopyrimidine deaminase/5-amino-6-(5-phosphoribosylamino)uracil reductase RibD [unclassified Martelella]